MADATAIFVGDKDEWRYYPLLGWSESNRRHVRKLNARIDAALDYRNTDILSLEAMGALVRLVRHAVECGEPTRDVGDHRGRILNLDPRIWRRLRDELMSRGNIRIERGRILILGLDFEAPE